MAWGEWMIPRLGLEHEMTLERQRRAIEHYSLKEAQDMLWKLCQLSVQQDVILRAATRHIAELECREAVREQDASAACGQPCHGAAEWPGV